jgi:hypothetical protein
LRYLAVIPKSSTPNLERQKMAQIRIDQTKERVQEENKRAMRRSGRPSRRNKLRIVRTSISSFTGFR